MTKKLEVKLGELLNSLSYGLDIAKNRYYGHSRRTSYIAYNIAREIGLEDRDVMDIYYASLIHDIGMAGNMSDYTVMDIHYMENLKKDHCSLGYEILKELPLSSNISKYVLYHHEEPGGTGPFGLKQDEIPLGSQIIHLADYFELFFMRKANFEQDRYGADIFSRWLKKYSNTIFNEELSYVLLDLLKREKFWLDLKLENIDSALKIIEKNNPTTIDIYELSPIAKAFSLIIDAKSKFTYEHSKGVSNHARNFAKYLGYDDIMVEKLTIAANLHDIGKFVVPSELLGKPRKLNESEFFIMKSHVYYSKLIIKQVEGLEDIAEWAGNHHEKLNGKGYPEKLDEKDLTKEDQIIVFADIYQALTEDRPYRKGMNPKRAIDIMENMAREGYICNKMLGDFKQLVL